MVDIETGKVIYKKPVIGSVPADIAAIDINGDSYIDRLYFGTTAGFIYKVQLETSARRRCGSRVRSSRRAAPGSTTTSPPSVCIGPFGDTRKYDPFQIFSTGGRPIYQEIAAIYVAQEPRRARRRHRQPLESVALRRPDRPLLRSSTRRQLPRHRPRRRAQHHLQRLHPAADRIEVRGDRAGRSATTHGRRTSSSTATAPAAFRAGTSDAARNEKVITEAFSLAGITIFTSFQPTEVANDDGTCSRAGQKPHLHRRDGHGARLQHSRRRTTLRPAALHRGARSSPRRRSSSRARPRIPRRRRFGRPTPTTSPSRWPHPGRAQVAAVDTMPLRELHSEHQDDPLGHRPGLRRPGSAVHRSDELEGVLMSKNSHLAV